MERRWKHFTDAEVEGLNTQLVDKLDEAREIAGVPFVITSGFRTPEKNDMLSGSSKNSSHLSGFAVDIRTDNSSARFKIVTALLKTGFNRIGVYRIHTHADIDGTKPQDVMWWK